MKTIIAIITFVLVVAAMLFGWGYFASGRRQQKVDMMLTTAEKNLQDGKFQEALEIANVVMDKYRVREKLPNVIAVRAYALQGLGQKAEAEEQWKSLRKDYPNSEFAADALVGVANAELEKNTQEGTDAAYDLYRQVEQKYKDKPAYYDALFGFAKIDMKDGGQQLLSAQKTLYRLLDEAPNYPRRKDIEETLGSLNLQLFNSNIPMEGESIHEIVKGDTLYGLQKKYKVNSELIKLVNRITDERKLRLGQNLKIPNIDFSIEVDKANNTLTLLNHGKFFKQYKVRTGQNEGQTPTGQFQILDKQKDPVWEHEGKKIPAGDPANQLGSRWMSFSGRDLGIHEAVDASTLGTYSSSGCVGLAKKDVEELYDLVPLGTPVSISGKQVQTRRHGAAPVEQAAITPQRTARSQPAEVQSTPSADESATNGAGSTKEVTAKTSSESTEEVTTIEKSSSDSKAKTTKSARPVQKKRKSTNE